MATPTKRNFNRLRAAMDKRYADWLGHREPEIANALEAEIADGASAEEVEAFAFQVSGEQDWFARRIAGAARHIESKK